MPVPTDVPALVQTIVLTLVLGGCVEGGTPGEGWPGEPASRAAVPAAEAIPPPECKPLWAEEDAAAFVETLTRATAPGLVTWTEYGPSEGAYVLDAGTTDSGLHCLGLWRAGRAESFLSTPDPPQLLTILYGYHLPYDPDGGPLGDMAASATQPEPIRTWLEGEGVETAVLMPVRIEGLPFEVSALQKAQTAIHEAFHVDVQAPRWLADSGDWPAWDVQPDREGVAPCYRGSPETEAALEAEREALLDLVTALLDDESAAACEAGEAFLGRRDRRHDGLSSVTVGMYDGRPGSCREAEALLEVEEGTADYVSWVGLFELGLATREDLLRRYRARQNEVFYLTGAMQLHAASLLADEGMVRTTRRIADSGSPSDGSPTAILAESLEAFCASDPSEGSGRL